MRLVPSIPHVPVVEPGLVFEVKLFQILQRDPLLLLSAPVEQTLHAALQTHSDVQPEGFAPILISFNAS